MRTAGVVLLILGLVLLIGSIYNGIMGHYQYERDFASYWSLAEKASTLAQKQQYIDEFVKALDNSKYKGSYNAIILKTPDNSFDRNFEALKSLQLRLHEIQKMDVTSFQYQTAIQQITAQEQGEASAMLDVFSGVWWLENHPWLWDWLLIITIITILFTIVLGGVLLLMDSI